MHADELLSKDDRTFSGEALCTLRVTQVAVDAATIP